MISTICIWTVEQDCVRQCHMVLNTHSMIKIQTCGHYFPFDNLLDSYKITNVTQWLIQIMQFIVKQYACARLPWHRSNAQLPTNILNKAKLMMCEILCFYWAKWEIFLWQNWQSNNTAFCTYTVHNVWHMKKCELVFLQKRINHVKNFFQHVRPIVNHAVAVCFSTCISQAKNDFLWC